MSETKTHLYSEMSAPHAGVPGIDQSVGRNPALTARQIKQNKDNENLMGQGFFPEEQVPTAVPNIATTSEAEVENSLRPRKLLFTEGMPMFRVSYDPVSDELIIPRAPDQAERLFIGRLPISQELEIDKSCLELGKKKDTVIKRVGKSIYGAFTIALYPTVDEEGKEVDIPILADMRRRSKEQNLVERFRRETSSLYYYAGLPRRGRI